MKVTKTPIKQVLFLENEAFEDHRGFFMETYHQERYERAGVKTRFVQDNISRSVRNTLRGLHYQHPHGQSKLVQVLVGEIFDVAVDIRRGSPTFGRWVGAYLSENDKRQLYIPKGFAHGFCVTAGTATVAYKCGDFYAPESEGGILWSDPDLAIEWPLQQPLLSSKDAGYPCLKDLPPERLPVYDNL